MFMLITEKQAKSILSVSKVYPYVINPYTGCEHNCTYCYARFMQRYSGHAEHWGDFVDVKMRVTTADDAVRKLFEPQAPPIAERVRALDELHRVGIRTFVMIAPLLPGAEGLAEMLAGKVDRIIYDRMNYHYADWVYRKYGLMDKLTDDYYYRTEQTLSAAFTKLGMN